MNRFKEFLHRLLFSGANIVKDPRENYLVSQIARGAASSVSDFANALYKLRQGLMVHGCDDGTVEKAIQGSIQRARQLLFTLAYENVPVPRDYNPPAAEVLVRI